MSTSLNDISRRILEAERGIGEPPTIDEIRDALAQRIGKTNENFQPRLAEKPKRAKQSSSPILPDVSEDEMFAGL